MGRGALSIAGFCDYASVGRTTALAEVKAGRLIAHKRGRSTIILIEDADAWLQSLPRVRPSAPDAAMPESPSPFEAKSEVVPKSSGGKDDRPPRARHRTSSLREGSSSRGWRTLRSRRPHQACRSRKPAHC